VAGIIRFVSEIRFRVASDPEHDEFKRLYEETLMDALPRELKTFDHPLDKLLHLSDRLGFVRAILVDGEVAGFVWLEFGGETLHVHALQLKSAWRGRGIARQALEALERQSAGLRLALVELGIAEQDARRQPLRKMLRALQRRRRAGPTERTLASA
jgi:GNAT superfamily N-acetyltransferase